MIRYVKMIEWALTNYPDCKIFDSLSPNQETSKKWLVEELSRFTRTNKTHKVEVVGSWYGYPLIEHLVCNIPVDQIECWDIDKEARMIARHYIELFDNEFTQIFNKDYWSHPRTGSDADIIINTSSEHMSQSFWMMSEIANRQRFYNQDPLIVIQSNDMVHVPEHINCVGSVDELVDKHRINEVLYAGEQTIVEWDGLEVKPTDYSRFMVIGKI
jgi:hypothetical protein